MKLREVFQMNKSMIRSIVFFGVISMLVGFAIGFYIATEVFKATVYKDCINIIEGR